MIKICETCGTEITNFWGYLSDFYPAYYPPRDRSGDQTLYGIQWVGENGFEFHAYCSEKHAKEGWKKLGCGVAVNA